MTDCTFAEKTVADSFSRRNVFVEFSSNITSLCLEEISLKINLFSKNDAAIQQIIFNLIQFIIWYVDARFFVL